MSENSGSEAARLPSPAQADPRPASVSSGVKVDLGALSHAGKVRPNNEDSFLVTRFERTMCALLTNLPASQVPERYGETGYVMLVADGMGGHSAGEVASRTAVGALVDLVIRTPDWIMRPDGEQVDEVLRRMAVRFDKLTDALTARAEADPSLSGMGTTLTLAVSLGPHLVIAHVGASRAYLFRSGWLLHLTSDQTVAQVLADAGVIRPEDVATHHARRMLTGAITAGGRKAEVELHHLRLADGDQLLLCSDGLTEMVADSAIATVLKSHGDAADACRALVALALEAGGVDNVTVILARYRIDGGGAGEVEKRNPRAPLEN